jgi:hypothetical protein
MNGFLRVVLLVVCGGLMALAALAGQVGYGDDYGRAVFPYASIDTSEGVGAQANWMIIGHQTQAGVEKP